MTEAFLPCVGGPFAGQKMMPGDDVPEGWRITVSRQHPTESVLLEDGLAYPKVTRGVYVRKGDKLVWEEGIK